TIAWRIPFGDTPSIRQHPALKGLTLPAALGVAGAPGAIATKSGLVFVGGGDGALHAIESATENELWSGPLARRRPAAPMTYRAKNGSQYVVIATGNGANAELVAFALR